MGTDLSGSLIGLILPLILSYINQESLNLIRQRLYKQKNIYSYFDFCNCCFESGLSYEEGEKLFEKFHNYGIIIKPTGSSLFFANPPIDDFTVDSILSSLTNLKICIADNDNILIPSVLPLYTGKYQGYHNDQEKKNGCKMQSKY